MRRLLALIFIYARVALAQSVEQGNQIEGTPDGIPVGVQGVPGGVPIPVTPMGGPVTVTQGTVPWVISHLVFGNDSVTAYEGGTWTVQQGSPPWSISLPPNAAEESGGHLESIDTKLSSQATAANQATQIANEGTIISDLGTIDSDIKANQPRTATEGPASSNAAGWWVRPGDGTNAQAYTASGEAKVLVTPLTSSSVVTVDQGTSPWLTSRNWTLSNGTDSIAAVQSGTWTVQQGTPPWSVVGTGTTGLPAGNILSVQGTANTDKPVIVAGSAAVGSPPANNPVGIAGVDGSGNKRIPLTDVSGKVQILVNDTSGTGISAGYGSAAAGIRTDSQIGNTTGQADYNYGSVGAQTLRVAAQGGNATGANDYNSGAAGAQTPRIVLATRHETASTPLATESSNGSSFVDFNYGAVGAATPRSAAQLGNSTGAADFGSGSTTSQTLRASVNQGTANTTENAWPIRVTDATNTAIVEPSSTSVAATDPALAVSLSPNSPTPLATDRIVTGSITAACASGSGCAAGTYVQISVNGAATLGFETHGTWSATMTTDVSYDSTCLSSPGTSNWFSTGSIDTDQTETVYLVNWGSTNNNDPWIMPVAGAQCARVRATAFVSGPVLVTLDAAGPTAAAWTVPTGNTPSGNTDFGSPIKVGAKYNATDPTFSDGNRTDLQSTISGRLKVDNGGVAVPMINRVDVNTTVSSSGNSSTFESSGFKSINSFVNVTAASGTTPTLQVHIQISDDNSNWSTLTDTSRFSTTGNYYFRANRLSSRYYRYSWDVTGGTPSFTFTVTTTLKINQDARHSQRFFYSDIDLSAKGNKSSTFLGEDCRNIGVVIIRAAGGANATVQMFGSNDATNWFSESGNIAVNPATTNEGTISATAFVYHDIQVTANAGAGTTADLQWSCN